MNLNLALCLTEFAIEPPWHSSCKFAWLIGIGAEIIKKALCEVCAWSRAVAKIICPLNENCLAFMHWIARQGKVSGNLRLQSYSRYKAAD
jgi:hypothetical protein